MKLGAFSLISFMNERIMNRSLLSANVGECLLAQPAEQDTQKDVWSLGLLLLEMLEPDSVFLETPPSTLQRPDSIEPCAVDFLARTFRSAPTGLLLSHFTRFTKLTRYSMNSWRGLKALNTSSPLFQMQNALCRHQSKSWMSVKG